MRLPVQLSWAKHTASMSLPGVRIVFTVWIERFMRLTIMNSLDECKLPRPKKCNQIDYAKMSGLINGCFDQLLDQIGTKSTQEDGGTSDTWYFGLVCYLRSIADPITEQTEIPTIIIAKHVPYKIHQQKVALNAIFSKSEIQAILKLVAEQ